MTTIQLKMRVAAIQFAATFVLVSFMLALLAGFSAAA